MVFPYWLFPLTGRRLHSDVVAWKAGAHTAEVKPWHFKRIPVWLWEVMERQIKPCGIKKDGAPTRTVRPRSHHSINTEKMAMALGDRAFLSQKMTFLFKAFLLCFVLLSSRLFSYLIGADGRLAMLSLVFSFGSVVFSFGGQVSELLNGTISQGNIDFLLEESLFFHPKSFYDSFHKDTTSCVRNEYHTLNYLPSYSSVIFIRTQLKGLLLFEHLLTNLPSHNPSWLDENTFFPSCATVPWIGLQHYSIWVICWHFPPLLLECILLRQARSPKHRSVEAPWFSGKSKDHRC